MLLSELDNNNPDKVKKSLMELNTIWVHQVNRKASDQMSKKKKKQKKTTLLLSTILKKQVVDSNGEIVGSVEDIMVTIGGAKPEALLSINTQDGKEVQVSFTDVSVISEVVLLSKDIIEGTEALKPAASFAPAKTKKPTAAPAPPPPPATPTTKKCGKCGFDNRPDSKFCIKCGNKLV
jgi:sporulation protein YlmC with PRC-barrel domain